MQEPPAASQSVQSVVSRDQHAKLPLGRVEGWRVSASVFEGVTVTFARRPSNPSSSGALPTRTSDCVTASQGARFGNASPTTLALKLIRIDARVRISARRIHVAMSNACPTRPPLPQHEGCWRRAEHLSRHSSRRVMLLETRSVAALVRNTTPVLPSRPLPVPGDIAIWQSVPLEFMRQARMATTPPKTPSATLQPAFIQYYERRRIIVHMIPHIGAVERRWSSA